MSTANNVIFRISSPSLPSCIAVAHMPSATPACGSNVIPRYLHISGEHFVSFALPKAPKYFPSERNTMYNTPTITIEIFVNTPK